MDGEQKASGALFGLACGDALGAPTEFMSYYDAIEAAYGPDGPRDLVGDPARVTDDTQMTLSVAGALATALEQPPLRSPASPGRSPVRHTGSGSGRQTGSPASNTPNG